jgi:putative OPT family oligopeptide transporter
MLQDLKVGHILGGTPSKMQWGDILGIVVAGSVMYFPLLWLSHGGVGFGGKDLPAPQAGLMALLAKGIVSHEMAWPLVVVGMLMGLAFVLVKVRSPMLLSVGMYLPLETTFAIFCGGIIRWLSDKLAARRKLNAAQRTRTDNAGVLVASGLIAGEALTGLAIAGYLYFKDLKEFPGYLANGWANSLAPVVMVALALYMIFRPHQSAGAPDEPPPPSAVM